MEKIDNIVIKIQNKEELGKEIIDELISKYTNDEISDDEILPVVKAIYYSGLCDKDLYLLTDAMKNSGEILDLSELGTIVDKHSTGGVSDTTTIIIAPICACLDCKMLKLSGRGLAFTGGTCDKLESFVGYKTDLDLKKAIELTKKNGACLITSSKNIAPADKKMYALRNRTNLVDNIQLIASSIMSKKLAAGTDIIVLDVKYGNGAFMPNKKIAKQLGKKMTVIGKLAGKKIAVVYGKMNQPLGCNIGPKLEAMEAVKVLKNEVRGNLYKDSVRLASKCVSIEKNISFHKAKKQVIEVIKNGKAVEKLKTMVLDQGGKLDLFTAQYDEPIKKVYSKKKGRIKKYNTKEIGYIVAKMGTNKFHDEETINYDLGVIAHYKLGEKIKDDKPLFSIFAKNEMQAQEVECELLKCVEIK